MGFIWVQNQSFQGYIQHGFKFSLHEGANLISCPCFNETPIEEAIPSDILDIITGIILRNMFFRFEIYKQRT